MRRQPELTDTDLMIIDAGLEQSKTLETIADEVGSSRGEDIARATIKEKLYNKGLRLRLALVAISDDGRDTLARLDAAKKAKKVAG